MKIIILFSFFLLLAADKSKDILVYAFPTMGQGDVSFSVKLSKHLSKNHRVTLFIDSTGTPVELNVKEMVRENGILVKTNYFDISAREFDYIFSFPAPVIVAGAKIKMGGTVYEIAEYNAVGLGPAMPPFLISGFGEKGILALKDEELAEIKDLKELPYVKNGGVLIANNYFFAYANGNFKYVGLGTFISSLTQRIGSFTVILPGFNEEKMEMLVKVFLSKVSNFKGQLIFKNAENCVVHSQEIGEGGEKIEMVIGNFNHDSFLSLLKHSSDLTLVTGDQSFSEALSLGKLPLYQVLPHKFNLWKSFVNEFTDEEQEFLGQMGVGMVQPIELEVISSWFDPAYGTLKKNILLKIQKIIQEQNFYTYIDSLIE